VNCSTIGCKQPATHTLIYTFRDDRTQIERDSVCEACGQGYTWRPSLQAVLVPLGVQVSLTQYKALVTLKRDGVIHCYNGVSLATARALHVKGLATLVELPAYINRGVLGRGHRTIRQWKLEAAK
jgi:hypothetical protein